MTTLRPFISQTMYRFLKPQVIKNMRELERIQWLPRADVLALQQHHLYQMLQYAYEFVPYYHDLFNQVGFKPDDIRRDAAFIEKIPPLSKTHIRENYDRLITTHPVHCQNLYKIKTGGTTGEPLWFTKDPIYRDYNTAHDYHVMTWAGWRLGEPQFWLWGHVPDDNGSHRPSMTALVRKWLAARYDSNAFIMGPDSLDQFASQLEAASPGILWSYVSTAYRFAQFLEERGHQIKLKAVYTAAEPLFDYQRQTIEAALGCPVFNNYSSIDTGDIAVECEKHDGLHIMTRNVYVEVMRNEEVVLDGEEGEFLITTLTNYGMPLVRYRIEDWGRKSTRPSPSGRGLPMLEVVEGRKIDLFKTKDGRTVYGAFAKDLIPTLGDVKQFQVVQKSLDLVVFRIVHDGELNQEQLQRVIRVSKDALGQDVDVQFEFVDRLPATPTGKHRYLVSEVTE